MSFSSKKPFELLDARVLVLRAISCVWCLLCTLGDAARTLSRAATTTVERSVFFFSRCYHYEFNSSPVETAAFRNYTRSQGTFAKRVADLAANPNHAGCLCENHAVEMVRPLVANADDAVRTNALLGLTRMARHSASCARQILRSEDLLADILGRIPREDVRVHNTYSRRRLLVRDYA